MRELDGEIFMFGNWKMAQNLQGFQEFVAAWPQIEESLAKSSLWSKIEACVFPSFVQIPAFRAFRLKSLLIGAQDCSSEKSGAFTGEISASSLAENGAQMVLIGHSERRQRAAETPSSLLSKLQRATEANLRIVYCVGESEEQRAKGQTLAVLKDQLSIFDDEVLAASPLIAYEPVWAIGTGKLPSLQEIADVQASIQELFPQVPVLYGGSVHPANAGEILAIEGVRGLLVGGASLKKESFKSLLECALEYLESS
jgi:triosephosphate isomerase